MRPTDEREREHERAWAWLILATSVLFLAFGIALLAVFDSVRLAAAALGIAAVLNGSAFYLRRDAADDGAQTSDTAAEAPATSLTNAETGLPVHPDSGFYLWWVFRERAKEEIARAERHRRTLAIVLLEPADLLAGPMAHTRASAAATLRSVKRVTDFVTQYDSQRFAVLLPETDREGTQAASKRLVQSLSDANDSLRWRAALVSYPADGDDPDALLEQADRLLRPGRLQGTLEDPERRIA